MTAWNDHHYTRAQDFARLLADALATARTSVAATDPDLTAAPFVRPPLPSAPPLPAPAAAPATAPAPVAPAAAAPGPSASSVFKKIPWKK